MFCYVMVHVHVKLVNSVPKVAMVKSFHFTVLNLVISLVCSYMSNVTGYLMVSISTFIQKQTPFLKTDLKF